MQILISQNEGESDSKCRLPLFKGKSQFLTEASLRGIGTQEVKQVSFIKGDCEYGSLGGI